MLKNTNKEIFNVPFTIATSILKKIEDQFIIKHTSEKNLNDWPDHIKFKTFIKSIQINHLHSEFDKLDPEKHYWIIIVLGENSSGNLYIYDSKVKPIPDLLSIFTNDFYLIDKKYNWFTYFNRSPHSNEISIYKSSSSNTPLE